MTTSQYTYNGDGQRVQVVDSQGTKKQIWDGKNILLETDGADATQVVYTQEPADYGNLVSQRRGSTTSTFLFDALGSTRKVTNSAGSVTDSYEYRAYGEIYTSSGTTVNVFRWVGELGYYYDVDRQAYYLRARPYSPELARFLSQDPIGFEGSPWNLYEYGRGSPSGNVDPNGLKDALDKAGDPSGFVQCWWNFPFCNQLWGWYCWARCKGPWQKTVESGYYNIHTDNLILQTFTCREFDGIKRKTGRPGDVMA